MNYLRILKPLKVYASHELSSKQIKTLDPDTIISYNREKRRDKIDWMEIYIEEGKVAYIKNEYGNFYKCENVKLNDESAQGYSLYYKTDKTQPIDSIFSPKGTLTKRDNIGVVKFESIEELEEDKKIYIEVEYDKTIVETTTLNLTKNEGFYIINSTCDIESIFMNGKKSIFMEIDNFKGKKGFILKETNYTTKENWWVLPVIYLTMFIVIGGLIIAGLSQGWLVISGLMVIPAVIVAFIVIIILHIIISILKGVFRMIRKRF